MTGSYSIAVFGSLARGEIDEFSDQDLLVVFKGVKPTLKALEERFGTQWSFSIYSRSQMEALGNRKSLFVTHLKLESKILEDTDGWLRKFLGAHQPSEEFENDANETLDLLPLLSRYRIDATTKDFSAIADIAYIVFRNYFIFVSANSGEYRFSFSSLIRYGLEAMPDLRPYESILHSIRIVRSEYKDKIWTGSIILNLSDIVELFTIIDRNFEHRFASYVAPPRLDKGLFYAKKDIEGILSTLLGRRPRMTDLRSEQLQKFWTVSWEEGAYIEESGQSKIEFLREFPLTELNTMVNFNA